jgi:hypothetical protein
MTKNHFHRLRPKDLVIVHVHDLEYDVQSVFETSACKFHEEIYPLFVFNFIVAGDIHYFNHALKYQLRKIKIDS